VVTLRGKVTGLESDLQENIQETSQNDLKVKDAHAHTIKGLETSKTQLESEKDKLELRVK